MALTSEPPIEFLADSIKLGLVQKAQEVIEAEIEEAKKRIEEEVTRRCRDIVDTEIGPLAFHLTKEMYADRFWEQELKIVVEHVNKLDTK